ncbi:MAG: FAD-dependent monooxygenase, partial [Burkholderiales bacterium]
MEIIIVGGGIGGLTLALHLQARGRPCTVYEAAPALEPLGLGINLLPHSTRILAEIGMLDALEQLAVTTAEAAFFNRFGQLVYREPAGRFAGFRFPQLSIHRGDLQLPLAHAWRERAGADRLVLAHRCIGFEQDAGGVTAHFEDTRTGERLPPRRGDLLIAADGLHSAVRRQLHPHESEPKYSGVNMWRGATLWPPVLTGASMIRAGWLSSGKMVIYPIRDDVDGRGNQ